MRVGIADHLGWAVVVTADARHEVIDRRRVDLVEPGISAAPIHYDRGRLDDEQMAETIATVRASIERAAGAALDALAADLTSTIESLSLRDWPDDFPVVLADQRRPPYEARVDAIRYRQVLAEVATTRGWTVHRFDARSVDAEAAALLGAHADEVLRDVRRRLGAPWTADHRMALAATVVAGPQTLRSQ